MSERRTVEGPVCCPFCDADLMGEGLPYCRACGVIIRCPRCGRALARRERTCPNCGIEIGGPGRAQEE